MTLSSLISSDECHDRWQDGSSLSRKSFPKDGFRSVSNVSQISDCMLYFTWGLLTNPLKEKLRLPGITLGYILGVVVVMWWGIPMCGYITI